MITLIISYLAGPALAALLFVYIKYRYPNGYFGLLIRSYFWGIIGTVFAAIFFYIAYSLGYIELKNLRRMIFYSFFILGFGQELGKFVVLRYMVLPSKYFKNPSDGIIYSLMISFGAATALNIGALLLYPETDPAGLISRTLVAISFAVIMGFFVGMGKHRSNRLIDSLTGLLGAAFFHGSFEFILITDDQLLLWPFLVGSAVITYLFVLKSLHISDDN